MLGESSKARKCMFCSKELSLLQRVRGQRFCSEPHHKAYLAKNERLAFAELVRAPDGEETGDSMESAECAADPKSTQESLANLQRHLDDGAGETTTQPPAAESQPASPCKTADIRRHVLDHLPGGIAVFQDPHTAIYFNEPYRRIWAETGGREPDKVSNAIEKAFQDGLPERELRIVLRPGKGGTVRIKLIPLPASDSNGGQQQLMVFATRVLPVAAPKKRPQRALATAARAAGS